MGKVDWSYNSDGWWVCGVCQAHHNRYSDMSPDHCDYCTATKCDTASETQNVQPVRGDVAGETRFGTMQGRVSASYAKKMGGYRKSAHYLVFGADAAFSQRRIRTTDLRWGTQHDGNGGFDPNLPAQEPLDLLNENFIYCY